MKALINGKIITKDSILEDKVLLYDQEIVDIVGVDKFTQKDDIEVIDVEGKYISPGFIDIHIHGSGGKDTMDGNLDAIREISKNIAKKGVTSFLPTTMTMSKDRIYQALDVVRQAITMKITGAKVLGAHMEGPFINIEKKGAQNAKYIEEPNYEMIKDYLDIIRIITLAPEVDQDHQFIKKMQDHPEVVLSIGHSTASYKEAMSAIDAGVRHATHTFNAMTGLHHRNPGIVGAIFGSDISCELIADKIHVHPGIFPILTNIKGTDKLTLITDSMRAGCMKEGNYDLGGQKVIVKDGSARLEDGTLAGSVLTLNKAVKNIFENTELDLSTAVSLASLNPAEIIGVADSKGSLEPGKDADIIVFNNDFEVALTIVEGETV